MLARSCGRVVGAKVEKTVNGLLATVPTRSKTNAAIDMQTRGLERRLARDRGEQVSIRPKANGDYVLQLDFADLANLTVGCLERSDRFSKLSTTLSRLSD